MKAFKEWDKKEYPISPTYERGPVGRSMLQQRKHAWRAALEWAKEMANENFLHGANVNIWNEIEQELADDSPVSS